MNAVIFLWAQIPYSQLGTPHQIRAVQSVLSGNMLNFKIFTKNSLGKQFPA